LKKFKASGPKRAKVSMTPLVYLTPHTAKRMNDFTSLFEKRMKEGRRLVLLEAAHVVLTELKRINPDVDGKKYTQDLEIAILSGVSDEEAIVLYYNKPREMEAGEDINTSILFFAPTKKAEPWVKVLQKYQPWPAFMLPTTVPPAMAKVVSRRIRSLEMDKFKDKILKNKRRIESELAAAGQPGIRIPAQKEYAAGMQVVDDMTYAILRTEFGYRSKADPHWRPALKALKRKLDKIGEKFVRYVETGNKSQFTVPAHGTESSSILKADKLKAAKKLSRASGLG